MSILSLEILCAKWNFFVHNFVKGKSWSKPSLWKAGFMVGLQFEGQPQALHCEKQNGEGEPGMQSSL
jgi:hypothetical protein